METVIASLILVLSQLSIALEQPKPDIKTSIMQCESGGNPKAINYEDAKITGYPSKGLYQFQPKTFLKYGIKYKVFPEGTTLKEAEKKIYDPAYNAAVAHGMIDEGLTSHWLNCFNSYKNS